MPHRRLAVTADRNGMLTDRDLGPLSVDPSDIRRYVALDRVAQRTEIGDVVEYWKSAPYLLNFMDGYQLVRKLSSARRHADGPLAQLLAEVDDTIDWSDVASYQEIDPGNAKLRAFLADLTDTGMWRWLWMPPALPYYSPGVPFDGPDVASASKRLVFSSWTACRRCSPRSSVTTPSGG